MFRIILLCILLLTPKLNAGTPSQQYKYHLSILTIFNNDARFLKEWIEYHLLVGVDHFYLYNNRSDDNYLDILQPYIEKGIVDLKEWPFTPQNYSHWQTIQFDAYRDGIRWSAPESKWLAVIDTDEFIFPVVHPTLREFLAEYDKYGGVVINWQQYGTSEVLEIPEDQLMIETLTWKALPTYEENFQFKTILKPKYVTSVHTAHSFAFKSPWYAVNSSYSYYNKIQQGGFKLTTLNLDKIRINHYWTRDIRFFEGEKIARQCKMHKDAARARSRADAMNAVEDLCMDKYVPELRNRMLILQQ